MLPLKHKPTNVNAFYTLLYGNFYPNTLNYNGLFALTPKLDQSF